MMRRSWWLVVVVVFLALTLTEKASCNNASDEEDDDEPSFLSSSSSESVEDDGDMEMPEYADDHEVKFVSDLYDDDRSHLDFYQEGNAHNFHYERCPPLPEPSAVSSSLLCNAVSCRSDADCHSEDDSLICCYNGCVNSCLPKVNPPVAFDWVEETDLKYPYDDPDAIWPSGGFRPRPKALMDVELSPETVALPGGCFLSSKQYDDLVLFRKFDHVKACSCLHGEVSCEINHHIGIG